MRLGTGICGVKLGTGISLSASLQAPYVNFNYSST